MIDDLLLTPRAPRWQVYADLWRQNRERQARVPEHVIQRMLTQWQTPDLTEAHALTWVESGTAGKTQTVSRPNRRRAFFA